MKQFLLLFLIFSVLGLSAQESCSDKLEQADELFNQGRFTETISLIKDCANSDDPTTSWKAYRLLAMAYLSNNQITEARTAAENMVTLNWTYEPDVLNDPKNFQSMLAKIDIIPKFSTGLSVNYGGNFSFPQVTGTYNPTSSTKTYKNRAGYQLGFVLGYNINDLHGFDLMLNSKTRKYRISYPAFESEVRVDETLNSFDFPLLYRYSFFPRKRFRVSAKAGVYGSLLINSFNDLTISNNEGTSVLAHYSSKIRRNALTGGVVGGVGLTYKWKKEHLSFDMQFFKNLKNITNEEVRYDNATLIYDYHYLDDDLLMNDLAITIGYHRYINYKLNK